MHELPLVQSIIAKASAHAFKHGARKIKSISLVVGDGTGYVPESIQMYFDIIAEGTLCQGAEIKITRVKPMMKCCGCGGLFERKPFTFDCPECGGEGSPTETATELYIEDIEIYMDKGDDNDEADDTGSGNGGNTQ